MIALHVRIRGEIEAQILSGTLPAGARVPVEQMLMERYGCSRMTVSKALAALSAAGLIERRRGAGSFVTRPKVHAMVLEIPDLAAHVTARGQRYSWMLESHEARPPDATDPTEADIAHGAALLVLTGVHRADDVPFATEDRIIALAAVPDAAAIDFAGVAPGTWLLEHVPWTQADTRIAAVAVDNRTAQRLGVPAGTACLAVERRTWRGGEPVTFVRQQFVGSAFDLAARFGPATSPLDHRPAA